MTNQYLEEKVFELEKRVEKIELSKIISDLPSINEPCDDAVSRVRALEPYKYLNDDDVITVWMIKININELPSVTQKSGKWITDARTYYEELNKRGLGVDEYTPYFTDDIACSECLAKYNTIDNETQFFKYCPNCGAKMESEVRNDRL